MITKCDRCGIEALTGEEFTQERVPFRPSQTLCPVCHNRYRERFFGILLLGSLIVGGVAAIIWTLNPDSHFLRPIVYGVILECMLVAVTVVHEWGHAFVGRWVGFEVAGVTIGWWGRILFRRRILGFDTIVRSVPFGGLAHVVPTGQTWRRTRHFLVVVAGPASNFLLATILWYPDVVDDLVSVRLESLGLRGLFVAANLLVVIENLVPAIYQSPWGRVPSDGLALMQLVFLRRMPYAPERKSGWSNWWHGVVRWALILICGGLCLLAVGLTIMVLASDWPSRRAMLVVAGVFSSIAILLAWLMIRAWRDRVPRVKAGHARSMELLFQEEIAALSGVSKEGPLRDAALKLDQLSRQGRAGEMEDFFAALRREYPDNLWLQVYEAGYLKERGRLAEAAHTLASIRQREGLSSPARTVLLTEELRARALGEQFGQVRELCQRFLSESSSVTEKVYLLDTLACLPLYEGLTAYIDEAEKWCMHALSLLPNSLTLKGTMGALLCERGEYERATALLNEVVKHSPADIDQAMGSFCLGLIAKAKGDLKFARKMGRKAKNACTTPALADRIEKELGI